MSSLALRLRVQLEALTRIPKNTVESHVRGLESMEISSDMYGCFLMPTIMQKLPEESRIAITCNLGSKTWNLKVILSEFHKELQLREQCLLSTKELRPSSSSQRGESLHSTSALFSGNS